MTPEINTIIDAALRLPPEQQREVVRTLSERLRTRKRRTGGDVTKFFGTFHSSNPNGSDNEKIDADLADSYLDTHDSEN